MVKETLTWLVAFKFKTDSSLEELHDYLVDSSGRKWFKGSKAFIGDYTSNQNPATGTVTRVFETEDGFAFDILNKTGCSEEEFTEAVENFKNLLKNKGASDFEPTEDFY